jgi:hypothetical protein
MRSAWAGGLHLRSRTDERRAGREMNSTHSSKAHSSTTDTNATIMLLPDPAGRKQGAGLVVSRRVRLQTGALSRYA